MRRSIYRILNINADEFTPVALLLALGFSIGLFLATVAVAATTLFLNTYSETEDLPMALLISGALAIFFTGLYSFFQGKISQNALSITTIIIFIILTSLIEFGIDWVENDNVLYYFAFTLILPFTFVSRLIFWNAFNRLFDLHQIRRIVGTIDMGMDVASVIAFFAIPIILNLGMSITSVFSLSLFSVIGFLLLYIVLSTSFLKHKTTVVAMTRQLPIKEFLGNKYILSISLFIILSTIAIRFVDYSFFNATVSQFDSNDLPYFLSYFEAIIVVFSFLVTLFLTDRINHEYGIRVSLIINPLLIFLFMGLALLLGYFMGYDPKLSNTTYFFFIMIAMGKLFIDSMREAIDEPTLKIYYIPFDKSIRNDIHTKLEGVIMGFSSVLAGGMIVLINRFNMFDLLTITLFIILVIAVWYLIINYMHKNYRTALNISLEKDKSNVVQHTYIANEYTIDNVLEEKINEKVDKKVIYSLKLMEKLDPVQFERAILKLTDTPSSLIRVTRYVRSKMRNFKIGENADSMFQDLASKAAVGIEDSELLSIPAERLIALGKSIKQSDRMLAAKLLRKLTNDRTVFTLLELLRDQDPKVREAALTTARKIKRPETWSILIEMLGIPMHSNHAAAALREAGNPALEVLNAAFYKTGQSDMVMQKVINIIGAIGGRKAISLMWQKASDPDVNIKNEILQAFANMRYTAQGQKISLVKNMLHLEMSNMLWNMTSIDEIPDREYYTPLKEALQEEVSDNYNKIILMLSIIYDRSSVQLVKENIDSQSSEGTAYAIELLNLFVDPNLKPTLIPLLENSSTREKADKLNLYFPRNKHTINELIDSILNRSLSVNNRWTKLCAMQATMHMPDFQVTQGLISQLFNEDQILWETAAWVVYNKNPKIYRDISDRIASEDTKQANMFIRGHQVDIDLEEGLLLNIEMINIIKELPVLKKTKGRLICNLADDITQIQMQKGEKRQIELNKDENPILIVARGEVKLTEENGGESILKKNDIFGDIFRNTPYPKITEIEAQENTLVLSLQASNFYFTLANNLELAYNIIENSTIAQPTN